MLVVVSTSTAFIPSTRVCSRRSSVNKASRSSRLSNAPGWVAGLASDLPERSSSVERRPAKLRCRQQPHGVTGIGQHRLDQPRQEPEALHQHPGLLR
jgi:hypothetical protein